MGVRMLKRLKVRRNGATSLSPREKVTQTYELLEQILHHLDPHSLRLAQLVSKYWHSIIHKSTTLQPRLSEKHRLCPVRALLIGFPGVGVDSLATCFLHGPSEFPYPPDPTQDPLFRRQLFVDGEQWLIEGMADGHLDPNSFPNYLGHVLANCEMYVLFYAVDSRESFDTVKKFLEQMESPTEPLSMMVQTKQTKKPGKIADGKCFLSGLVSTKNDLPASQRVVQAPEGAALARDLGCPFVETSAKTGFGVNDAFVEICRMYKRVWKERRRQQSKRTSLVKVAISPPMAEAKERKERWWRWYRAKHPQR